MIEKSGHLVDLELLELLEQWPTQTLTTENLHAWRAGDSEPAADYSSDSNIELAVHPVVGADVAPTIEVRVYRPRRQHEAAGCILHIHGGGFVGGSATALESTDRDLSRELQCTVATVDYRLAPETRFPGSVEDCYATLCWLHARAGDLAVDCQRIGVMGESAGGGLAAALALLARDRGGPHLAFQHLTYPMLDDRTCTSSDPNPYTGEFVWTRQNNHFGWSALLGGAPGADDVSLYAAPARAQALQGLPPTLICTGALDLFVDENIQYALRLLRAGVPTELHVYPGSVHGFDLHPTARVSRAARRDRLAALRRFLGRC